MCTRAWHIKKWALHVAILLRLSRTVPKLHMELCRYLLSLHASALTTLSKELRVLAKLGVIGACSSFTPCIVSCVSETVR